MANGQSKYHLTRNFFTEPKRIGSYSLYQVGRCYCNESARIDPHIHADFFEFTVVSGGGGTVITNGTRVPVRTGDIYVSFPGDEHEILSDAENPLRYDFLAVGCRESELSDALVSIVRLFHDGGARIIRDENITSLVGITLAEVNAEASYSEKVLEAIFTQIFCYTVRAFHFATPIHYSKGAGEDEMLCYQIMTYINAHVYTLHSLTEVADALSYNYNYLSNLYKKVTGDTLSDYYRRRRLQTARQLLLERGMGVSRVAGLLGYSSVYTFSRAFKEMYGIAPSRTRDDETFANRKKRKMTKTEIARAEEAIADHALPSELEILKNRK